MDAIKQKKRWIIAETAPDEFCETLGGYPQFLQQLLYNRGVRTFDEATTYLTKQGSLHDPFLLSGMETTVNRIKQALEDSEKIVIYGDYDVDGISATVLLVQVLRKLGGNVDHYIPNRFDEGYGLSREGLGSLRDQGAKLVITVDCGIRSPHEAEFAADVGLDLIISDHHSPKGEIPKALAVINPKQVDDTYPFRDLAGVGLAYKLAEALFRCMDMPNSTAEEWLDLVAIGTVADIVPLIGENRSLVRAGLKMLREGRRLGLRSLLGSTRVAIQYVSAHDIGFVIGPRLNASGRMESAEKSYQLLMTDDADEAGYLAQQLDDLNRKRQEETSKMLDKAEEILGTSDYGYDHLIFAVAPEEEFSTGLVGLAAARLTEKYYLPSIIGSRNEYTTRASCRSIPEFHITKALDQCADILEKHGGHAMAAGFTVRNDYLDILIQRLYEIARSQLPEKLDPPLFVDQVVSLDELRKQNAINALDALEPVGMDNPEALFMSKGLLVSNCRCVGSDGKHLKLVLKDVNNVTHDAIAFKLGHIEEQINEHVQNKIHIDIVYSYERNIYQGFESLQLNIRDLRTKDVEGIDNTEEMPM